MALIDEKDAFTMATMNGGGIIEKVDEAILKVLDNIDDVNTEATKKRRVTLEIEFSATKKRTEVKATSKVKVKLEPDEALETTLYYKKTMGGMLVTEHNPEQLAFPTEVPPGPRALEEPAKTPNPQAAESGESR